MIVFRILLAILVCIPFALLAKKLVESLMAEYRHNKDALVMNRARAESARRRRQR